MKRKLISALLCGAMAATMLAGCGSSSSDSSSTADSGSATTSESGTTADSGSTGGATGTGKIGISMPTQSLERWNRDGSYLDEQFQAAGYETIVTYSDNDSSRQVNDIQNMLAEDVDLLIVAAIDGEALNTAMNEAADAGVSVIAYDRLILNDAVSYYVSFDNYSVGTLQGQYIVDALDLENAGDKTYNIELTAGDPADNNAPYFFNGAMDVLQPYIDAGTLVVPSGQTDFDTVATAQWSTDTALERAQNILGSYYADGTQLDAWLCSNDSTALGVSQALTSDYAGSNTVIVTGQDGDEANLKNIVDGIQSMTVYKNVSDEAVATLALSEAILNGETIDASMADNLGVECSYDDTSYETSDGNPCPSFLLVPTVITADNLQDLVDTGLYTMGDDGYLSAVQ
ncbi:MAG TPA: sugar-binding protein [Candidatus Scatomonas pullistercoris]|uniref:Sugar-binding protein n=1 Tax=Candidatus Scatomonas pullistercoris TaxID=2840920 RepID=A0A9D1TB35_9FIRM|nr:sugar-binding protein [Candidatus Scatomonas pullistercoris]